MGLALPRGPEVRQLRETEILKPTVFLFCPPLLESLAFLPELGELFLYLLPHLFLLLFLFVDFGLEPGGADFFHHRGIDLVQ